MATPGFPPGTLDWDGVPVWVSDLAFGDPTHTVHVVRGLRRADALSALGARSDVITACQLQARRPEDGRMSLTRAAVSPTDSAAVLLAGQLGGWTFVYDDAGLSGHLANEPAARSLSAAGQEAATSTCTAVVEISLAYAASGELLLDTIDDVDPYEAPSGLSGAVAAAGNFASSDDEDGDLDYGINMRVLCALAGLTGTLDDLRQIPLLAAPLG